MDRLDASQKSLFILLYFANQPDRATVIANSLLSKESKTEYQIKQFLRSVGLFTKDNDSYFIRYFDYSQKEDCDIETIISEGKKFHIFFRQPNEIRMKAAYDVLAGWVLKFLYQKYNFIPLSFNSGKGVIWHKDDIEEDFTEEKIWTEFINWLPEDVIAQNIETLMNITGGKPIGKIQVPVAFIKKFGKAIVEFARKRPSRFQTNINYAGGKSHKEVSEILEWGFNVFNFTKEDEKGVKKEINKKHASWQNDNEIEEKEKEKRKSQKCKIGAASISGMLTIVRVKKLLDHLSTPYYLSDLKKRFKNIKNDIFSMKGLGLITSVSKKARITIEDGRLNCDSEDDTFCNFVLSKIRSNTDIKEIKKILKAEGLSLQGRNSLTGKDVLISKNKNANEKIWNLLYVEPVEVKSVPPFHFKIMADIKDSAEECIACSSPNIMKNAGGKLVLPESKKRFYDSPNSKTNPPVCPECFFASMISCFYPSQNYSVCEIPTKEFTETFLLAERTSNLTASLGAMQLSRASLYSVLPSKYIVVRLNNKKGKLPVKTQLYLLFSEYADSFDVPFIEASVEGAGLLEKLKVDVPILRILGILSIKVKPPSFVTRDQRGYAANDAIVHLEKGMPYTALYTLGGQALKTGTLYERTIFKSPYSLKDFDNVVLEQTGLLIKFLTGGNIMLKQNPKEFYEDVKGLSESLYNIIQSLAQDEVSRGGSNVSVVVRKYTDLVGTDFPKLNLENFQYWVAKKADDIEKAGGGYPPKGTVKKQLEELENDVVENFYKKYFEDGNAYLWRQFILEVNARLLSKLFLNVHIRKEG